MNSPVFFDLDGTLTDPKVGITKSIQFALQQLDIEAPEADELVWCIGPPLQTNFEILVGKSLSSKAVALYRERFSQIGWLENTPYPGVTQVLESLCHRQIPLYVATSKPHIFAERILDHFQLSHYFQRVFGSELDGTHCQKAELLKYALEETRSPTESTMIGDRKHDVVGAKNNGMNTIGVTYGYGSYAELQAAGAHKIIDAPAEILEFFR
ncbi:MAG: HAD-IA family hydrolase [Cyanobacteria bacterium P01_H01_bin.21]